MMEWLKKLFGRNQTTVEVQQKSSNKEVPSVDASESEEDAPWGVEALRGKGKEYDWGEGMMIYGNGKEQILFNTETKELWKMVDENGRLVGFTKKDVDYESVGKLEHSGDAYAMETCYGGIGRYWDFKDGICVLCWTLYPDGRYFADSDGFGMEDNDEVEVYAIIDRHMHVLIPFQSMTESEMRENCRKAREMLR